AAPPPARTGPREQGRAVTDVASLKSPYPVANPRGPTPPRPAPRDPRHAPRATRPAPHAPRPASWLLGRLRRRRRRLRARRGCCTVRHARQRNLRLRRIRRARRIGHSADLLCALHGTLDTRGVDRRLVLRLEHLREGLRHRNRLRLATEN